MGTILFNNIIFGPVKSRRLGVSLGVNLLPETGKLCSFDCIYCECGYNAEKRPSTKIPTREQVKISLEEKLKSMLENNEKPDVITFAGNGEPTLHPDFESIIDDTISLRNQYFPDAKISVLSNSSMIDKESVFRALNKVDNNILKLDSPFDEKMRLLDQPNSTDFNIRSLVENLKKFNGNLIIQTIFLKGTYQGQSVDNTGDIEIEEWIKLLQEINPKQVMIYTIDRETPTKTLEKVSIEKLNSIADQVKRAGFDVNVSG